MDLQDPIAAYNANSPEEAQLICAILNEAGIQAMTIDDHSSPGLFDGAGLDTLDKPQVWISRADAELALPLLTAYDNHVMRKQAEAQQRALEFATPIEIICSECGHVNEFPAVMTGTVQECVNCGTTVDVGIDSSVADWGWDDVDAEDDMAEEEEDA